MWPVSDAFTLAATTSHRLAAARVDVLEGPVVVASLGEMLLAGHVEVDTSAAVRRSCTLTLLDATGELTPAATAELLHPASGRELRLWRGIALPAGDELVPLGTFRISRPSIRDEDAGVVIEISGYDRARKVARARFPDLFTVPAATAAEDAIHDIIDAGVPGLDYQLTPTGRTVGPLTYDVGEDRMQAAIDIATAVGHELFFDRLGAVVSRPVPDAATDPVVAEMREGPDCTMVGIGRDLDDEPGYNHAVVSGEATDGTAPVRAEALDDDPNSPTYVDGPYGDVPIFLSSPLIANASQAQAAADALLRRARRVIETLEILAVPNPALDGGDVIRIHRPALQVVDQRHVVSRLSVPLDAAGAMRITTAAVSV